MNTSGKNYIVGEHSWIYPYEGPIPKGCKIHILNRGGVSIIGHWDDKVGHIAWAPLHKRDAIKEEIQRLVDLGVPVSRAEVLIGSTEQVVDINGNKLVIRNGSVVSITSPPNFMDDNFTISTTPIHNYEDC